MLKREITYEDFDGNTVTETFYFHLNEREVTKFNFDYEDKGGIQAVISKATASGEQKELFEMIDGLILSSYGVRSEDGKGFTKSEELRKKFMDSFAYEALYKELTSNDTKAAEFFKAIFPKGIIEEANRIDELMKPKDDKVVVNLPPVPTKE